MNSRIREAICLKTQPVAVIQTDHLPPRPKDGKPNTMAVFSPVWRMRPKERPWCFKRTRMPVRAAELGLGILRKLSIDPMAALLSKGKEGHGGMAYKKTPDLAVSYLHSLPETVPSKYVIFQPLDKLSDAVVPTAVIFFGECLISCPHWLHWPIYDRPNQDNVKVLFGAGCVQAVLYSMCDTEACILGANRSLCPASYQQRPVVFFPSPMLAFWRWKTMCRRVF